MRSAVYWDIPQFVVAIPYRLFGKTYRSHLEDRTASVKITTTRCVTIQKNADFIYFAADV